MLPISLHTIIKRNRMLNSTLKVKKILIIGAGIGGLICIRRAIEYNVAFVAYELTDKIGGVWVHSEHPEMRDKENNLLPAPLYDSLRTHFPKQVMELPDFPLISENCFPNHKEVLDYIHNFANHYGLLPHIKFNQKVVKVSRSHSKWIVVTQNILNNESTTEEFDGVITCSGHISRPIYPEVEGRDTFRGQQIHSCEYRNNALYSGKTVLIIGAKQSANDLSREIAEVANVVFVSHRRNIPLIISNSNIFQKPDILRIQDETVYFKDGSSELVDSIIYCTGYDIILPYLHQSCEVQSKNKIFPTLYKKFINAHHPTMCILGTRRHVSLFRLLDMQAEIFFKIMTSQITLPSKADMLSEIKKQKEKSKDDFIDDKSDIVLFESKKHFIEICNLGNFQPIPPVLYRMYEKNKELVINDFNNYKNYEYEIIDNNTFKCIKKN